MIPIIVKRIIKQGFRSITLFPFIFLKGKEDVQIQITAFQCQI